MYHNRLDFVLAFVEISSADGDPIERPSPWSWAQWQQVQITINFPGSPPWSANATFEETGLQQIEREYCRDFVLAYHGSGVTPESRRLFARCLDEGPAYKGLCHLGWWCGRFQPLLEGQVDRILTDARLISGGAKSILQMAKYNPYVVISTLADGLLGPRAYDSPSEQAYAWLSYMLASCRARWEVVYNTRMRFVDDIPRKIYKACQDVSSHRCCVHDIEHYLLTLRALLVELDFNLSCDREQQRSHYRELLLAFREAIDGGRLTETRPTIVLPPNLSKALALMESDRIPGLRRIMTHCSVYIEAGAEYVAEDHPDEFDAFTQLLQLRVSDMLAWDCSQEERAAWVQLESDFRESETSAAEWEDEDRAAFMFTITSLPRKR